MNNTIVNRRTHVSKIIGTDTHKAGLNVEGLKKAARMAGEAICFFSSEKKKTIVLLREKFSSCPGMSAVCHESRQKVPAERRSRSA